MEVHPRALAYYVDDNGRCPFKEWLDDLNDIVGKAQVDVRLTRLELGAFGECKDVGDGVCELIFKSKGPGYRIYFGQEGNKVVIILCAGSKKSQDADIARAKKYWENYKNN